MATFSGDDLTCIRGERCVFQGLDFAVSAGRALVLKGPNGSGKSSLLRLMAGLAPPAVGRLLWDGVAVNDDPAAHGTRLAYLGHLDAVKPHLSVAENLRFWTRLRFGPADAAAAIAEALETLAIGHLAEVPGRYLSAGQKRRVNLARVVVARPRLWLLDEPTTALDRETVMRVEALLTRALADGALVVLSTHTDIALGAAETLDLAAFAAPEAAA